MRSSSSINALILVLSFLIVGCSPDWHIRRAIKKDPDLLKDSSKTVYVNVPQVSGTVTSSDTLIVDNERIYIKATASGEIALTYQVKQVKVDTIIATRFIPKIVRVFKTRLEYKKAKAEIKYKYKIQKKEIKRDVVKYRNEGGRLKYLVIGTLLGFCFCRFLKKRV